MARKSKTIELPKEVSELTREMRARYDKGDHAPAMSARDPNALASRGQSLPEWMISKLPTGSQRDAARIVSHGLARTGNTILRAIDIPNRIFGSTRSTLQDIYERSEANLARDAYEDRSGVPQFGETAVHLASAGVLGRALPAVFGANTGVDTYEIAREAGAGEGEALAKGVTHGVVDTAIWTLGQGLASKYLPKAWQWLGREIVGAGRGAASSVTSDVVLNSLGADISGEAMVKRAVHAAWMVPLLGMLKMGGKRREEAMSLLRKARPDLAGAKADKVIETIEAEFSDPKSQKVALAWVARKGANLPDDTAQIRQALEVSSKVKGLDPMSRSPFEILSDPAYARYLPKPRPQDVKAFSNMKRYPMGVIGFDVSDDAAGRQATREMINAYMSPSSNPWCLATGNGAARLGELGPRAEGYWRGHSAVPKQIFFQEVDGKLELTAFRATSPGGEGRQEYWDTSDAGYSGIPLKVKVPGDPMGRYRKMVFRPGGSVENSRVALGDGSPDTYSASELRELIRSETQDLSAFDGRSDPTSLREAERSRQTIHLAETALSTLENRQKSGSSGEVRGTFEDIAPGKVFKGDPFRDGRSQTWVKTDQASLSAAERQLDEYTRLQNENPADPTWRSEADAMRETVDKIRHSQQYVLVEDKERTTENGITKFRTTKYADPTNWDYEPPKPGEQPKPVEIEESELVSPEWMRSRGYDPESESDVHRMQQDLNIQAWGNGQEAAMAVVPTKRTYMQTESGAPETVTYGPNGRDVVSVDFEKDGVPYREVYGARTDERVPKEILQTLDARDMPLAGVTRKHGGAGTTWLRPNDREFRLVRNPDSESPEVIDEIKWDDGLGGFVRTSGNRRWRMTDALVSPEVQKGLELFSRQNDAQRSFLDADERLAGNLNDEALNQMYFQALDANNRARQEYHTWANQHPTLVDSFGVPYQSGTQHLLIEARQPDGTWAPAMDTSPDGSKTPTKTSAERVLDPQEEAFEDWLDAQAERRYLDPEQRAPQPEDLTPDPIEAVFAAKAGRTRRDIRADAKGGDASGASAETPPSGPAPEQPQGGPRIVVNPSTFRNEKDALCVAFNEAFRVLMEYNGFDPVSEPTDEQRRFFADTAYADDELQLRRTILARVCTFDTSVKDPTDEQLQEAVEFLETVMEIGAPQNEWEQKAVQRLRDVIAASVGRKRKEAGPQEPPEDEGTVQGAIGGGMTDEERNRPENMVDAEGARAAEVAIGAPSYQQGDENLPGPDQQAQVPAEQAGQAQAPAEQKAQPQAANAEQSPTDQQSPAAQPEKPAQEPAVDTGTERFLYSWSSSGQMEIGEGSVSAAGADQPNGRPARRTIDQDIVPAGAKGSIRNSSNSARPITRDIVPAGAKGSILNSSNAARPITQDIVPTGSPGSLSYKKKRETT